MNETPIAVIFPGQGSQRVGMGKDFYDEFPESRTIYEEASDSLGWDVAAMCFEQNDCLNQTEYSQPCILTTEVAMYVGLRNRFNLLPDVFGGHSLGEYTAMVAAGAMPFLETLKIVEKRGKYMQKASPGAGGKMAAVIGENLDVDTIRHSIRLLNVDIANINSRDQIVISGASDHIDQAKANITKAFSHDSSLRFVDLNVSAPFHSRFMAGVRERFASVLKTAKDKIFSDQARRVTSNYTGDFHSGDSEDIINNLLMQLSGTVDWCENMRRLAGKAEKIYEVGPNRPLHNFFKTLGVSCKSITSVSAANRVFDA